MELKVLENKKSASKAAADQAQKILKDTIKQKDNATIVVATGASQVDFLNFLVQDSFIEWHKVEMFHLDEYVGLPEDHPASFRNYLNERLISKVNIGKVNLIQGDKINLEEELERLNNLLKDKVIDVSFVGIGENSHLAFNDPPADFEEEAPYIIVELDEKCRQQQVNEGWFETIDQVPKKAITMTVKKIMSSRNIICTVPGLRKAPAVAKCFSNSDITPEYPGSILKSHKKAYIFLDKESASLLAWGVDDRGTFCLT